MQVISLDAAWSGERDGWMDGWMQVKAASVTLGGEVDRKAEGRGNAASTCPAALGDQGRACPGPQDTSRFSLSPPLLLAWVGKALPQLVLPPDAPLYFCTLCACPGCPQTWSADSGGNQYRPRAGQLPRYSYKCTLVTAGMRPQSTLTRLPTLCVCGLQGSRFSCHDCRAVTCAPYSACALGLARSIGLDPRYPSKSSSPRLLPPD